VLLNTPDEHLTAEEIYGLVKQDWPDIGLATVYRNIQLLSDMHLIDKLNLDDGYVRYEISDVDQASHHHHHHLICSECGRVFAFEEDLLDVLEEKIMATTGFRVSDHEVKFFGVCRECREKDKK
jgi:Fur family ferric uptake transcriptional regulator